MARPTVKQIGDNRRPFNTSKNIYDESDSYNQNHPNAKSDGDAKGRGRDGGTIGTSIDIARRSFNQAKNKFDSSTPYKLTD